KEYTFSLDRPIEAFAIIKDRNKDEKRSRKTPNPIAIKTLVTSINNNKEFAEELKKELNKELNKELKIRINNDSFLKDIFPLLNLGDKFSKFKGNSQTSLQT